MSRYRPIAPKPESPFPTTTADHSPNIPHSSSSTFLRNVWPQLQARPTRTRKRARPPPISPHALKRSRTTPSPKFSLHHPFPTASLLPHLSLPFEDPSPNSNLITLPLLPCAPPSSVSDQTSPVAASEINFIKSFDEDKGMELNPSVIVSEIPQEKDLLQQLQCPVSTSNVITPHPVRPVGSSIRVGCINEAQNPSHHSNNTPQPMKKPDEVEKEVESEVLPAVISDSNNRVRMANSAYKEMVGQPECLWLDSMVTGEERLKGRRIGGEVMLHLSDAAAVPHSSNGFSCWVRIEWGNSDDGKKNSITAFCDVIKLSCVSRDYLFTWRFHTQTRDNHNNNASKPICINV